MSFNPSDSRRINDNDRKAILSSFQLSEVKPLAVGSESEVYALGQDRVLKLYANTEAIIHFDTLRHFYETLDTTDSDLAFPKIHDIIRHGNLLATVESRVDGVPLQDLLTDLPPAQHDQAENCYLDAVWKLRKVKLSTPPTTYMLFDQAGKSAIATQSFEDFYADLLVSKRNQVDRYFAQQDSSFPEKASSLITLIRQNQSSLSIVHGDFFPGNVLVDQDITRVTGIIDFGTFTLYGNYLLDVAGAFGFYQMYHPERRQIRESLLAKIQLRLTDAERPVFFQYLLANAILTSNLYAHDAELLSDGHFNWALEIVGDDAYWQQALG